MRDATSGRTGRRPGDSGSRSAIAQEARRQFAALGYERTTIRGIANGAEVDPSLVLHFFGSKHHLFITVVELPFAPAELFPALLAGEPSTIGVRFAGLLLELLESEPARLPIIGLVRAASSDPQVAKVVRELLTIKLFTPIVESLQLDDGPLRASLLGAQVVGLVVARYIVGVEALVAAQNDVLISAIAPTFQRLLSEPLRHED